MGARAETEAALLRELEAEEQAAQAEAEAEAELQAAAGSGDESHAAVSTAAASAAEGLSESDKRALAEQRALAASLDDLREQGDADGLLRRAVALRRSDDDSSLPEALECYQAAAELGSAEAMFAVALFYLNGVLLAEEISLGLGKLREAAGAGHLRARIYLANAYELGIGREPDKEKAAVWYRGVARALSLEMDDSVEFDLTMAKLGCVRYTRKFLRDDSLSKKDRYQLLTASRNLGHGLSQRLRKREEAEQAAIAAEVEKAAAADLPDDPELDEVADQKALEEAIDEQLNKPRGRVSLTVSQRKERLLKGVKQPFGERMTAFFGALFVLAVGGGVAAFASNWALAQVAAGEQVPLLGTRASLVFPVIVALTLLPVTLFYNVFSVALAGVAGLATAAAGWMLYDSGVLRLLDTPLQQVQAFGVGGIALALLLLALADRVRKRRFEP